MREIKFRYFDTKRQEFINDCDVYFIDSNCILAGDLDNPPVVDITNNVVVSQYTGLKDKNGKGIYEGDIVRYTSNERIGTRGNYKNSYSVYGDVEITGVVKFGNIEHHHDYKHILAFFVDSNDSISYDSYFYSDSKNRGPQKHTSKLTKPLLLKKEYEVIGNVYEGLLEESK